MKKPTIISLSGKAQHGKDSSVNIIQNKFEAIGKKCLHIGYGDYVKFICSKYYDWDGNKDEKGRQILQQIGTNKIRTQNPDFWVDAVINFVDAVKSDYDYVLISDSRFENEINRWKQRIYDIITIHVFRPNFDNGLTEEQKKHPSECALDDFNFEYYLIAENLDELENEIDTKLNFLFT